MDIIKRLQELPPFVLVEKGGKKYEFSLVLFINGKNDVRLTYEPLSGDFEDGAWNNPFVNPPNGYLCGFLFLEENIKNELDLDLAIINCKLFLMEHKLLE